MGQAPSLPGALTAGSMVDLVKCLKGMPEWVAWTKAEKVAWQYFRPMEHLVLNNAFLDDAF